jgi:hypothetical protein
MSYLHIRVDSGSDEPNSKGVMHCGLKQPDMPKGDLLIYEGENAAAYFVGVCRHMDACPGCFPEGKPQLGTPMSKLDGRDGGNAEWRRLSRSWGYD